MFCKQCGKQLPDGAQFCDGCGARQAEGPQNNGISVQNGGVPQGNSNGKPPKKKHGCLTAIAVFFGICIILAIIGSIAGGDSDGGSNGSSGGSGTASSGSEKSGDKSSFVDMAGVTAEQETAILDILKQCGIEEVTRITLDEGGSTGDIKCYELRTKYSTKGDVLLYLNGGVVGGITFGGEPIYKDGAVVTTPQAIIDRPDLEVLSYSNESDGYFRYVTGEIRNNTNKTYGYVQVTINLYSNDVQVGSTLDNINNLEPGGVWKFKAIVVDNSVTNYKIVDVSGF